MGVWQTREEIEEMLELIEKEMPFFEEGKKIYQDMLKDLPVYEAVKKQQLHFFNQLCPNRCGEIDFNNNTVRYNEEHFSKWACNFRIYEIRDLIKIFDYVGLDYEIRIADLYDISEVFAVFYVDTENNHFRFKVALELHSLFVNYYWEQLKKLGINRWEISDDKFIIPWRGCEQELAPLQFKDDDYLISEKEMDELLNKLYPIAYEMVAKPSVIEFKHLSTIPNSKKGIYRARLDKENLESCMRSGFKINDLNISAEQFQKKYEMKIEDGREIYYLEVEADICN